MESLSIIFLGSDGLMGFDGNEMVSLDRILYSSATILSTNNSAFSIASFLHLSRIIFRKFCIFSSSFLSIRLISFLLFFGS